MNKHARLRIHIAPLGFESDRIVLPAIELKADKVWILIHNNPKKTKAKLYLEDIKARLQKERIEFDTKELDRLNLLSTIKSVKSIVSEEKDNTYYVNVSSGSKIQAVACTMACMMFNEKNNNLIPYYAKPKDYFEYDGAQMSTGLEDLIIIPQYDIKTPDEKLVQALQIIKDSDNRINKTNLAVSVDNKKIIEIGARKENYEQARFTSLDKNIIQPLKKDWEFVKEEKIGRTRWIEITSKGLEALEMLD